MKERGVVSRHDWVHGLVPCPACALPLDPQKDRSGYLQEIDQAQAYGVEGQHRRCGAYFTFAFNDMRSSTSG